MVEKLELLLERFRLSDGFQDSSEPETEGAGEQARYSRRAAA
jgi:hypothetical protein